MTLNNIAEKYPSDKITLDKSEENAVFIAINHVDILQIKGFEFYHMFMIILLRTPHDLNPDFSERALLFYNVDTRDLPEEKVNYFNPSRWQENTLWETTISASSECAYDMSSTKLGNLIKVPNFDRIDDNQSGKRVFVKKIAMNNMGVIKRILEYEQKYDNSLKYTMIPKGKKRGFNSNSYFRGVLEYAGLLDSFEVPSCFRSPGFSKGVRLNY